MITILLTILKVLGILLLVLLMTAIVLLFLVLFVPVRYRISLCRRAEDKAPATIEIKVTWLLHLVNAAFSYPEAAFLRVRVFCFTVFRSDKKKKATSPKKQPTKETEIPAEVAEKNPHPQEEAKGPESKPGQERVLEQDKTPGQEREPKQENAPGPESEPEREKSSFTNNGQHAFANSPYVKIKEFLLKLLSLFQNIRYTITKICDKIKHIVNNIQYYLEIIKSDTFSRVWTLCSGEAFSLLKSILPGKVRGSLVIGTGDPASTGQVLAIYGILYPLLGDQIIVTPDFDRQIVEGELFLRGKITVFKGLKTAWKIYFSRDLRRLIQLLKREAA